MATYKDLVIDTGDAARLGRFWADHWDVVGAVEPLVDAGATVLRTTGGGLGWSAGRIERDPEGNEFCVFPPR